MQKLSGAFRKTMREELEVINKEWNERTARLETDLRSRISELVLDAQELHSRINNLRIFGVPEAGNKCRFIEC